MLCLPACEQPGRGSLTVSSPSRVLPLIRLPKEETSCILGLFPPSLSPHLAPLYLHTYHLHLEPTKPNQAHAFVHPNALTVQLRCFPKPAVCGLSSRLLKATPTSSHTLGQGPVVPTHPGFLHPAVVPPLTRPCGDRFATCAFFILGKMFCSTFAPLPADCVSWNTSLNLSGLHDSYSEGAGSILCYNFLLGFLETHRFSRSHFCFYLLIPQSKT